MALDEDLLREHQHKIWLYFAKHDDWVGDSREEITRVFHPDHEAVRVVHGGADIPHAFCIGGFPCVTRVICTAESFLEP